MQVIALAAAHSLGTVNHKNTALMEASQKLGEKVYADQAAAAGAAGGAAPESKPADPDVVDAEVKEVKKD